MLAVKVVSEGLLLGFFLYPICAFGIRNGAIGMVHLYSDAVKKRVVELGLTTEDRIRKRGAYFRCICLTGYIAYVLICVYGINKTRGFLNGFFQIFIILSIMNLIDRFLIDEYWVGHTDAWNIPGTEDLKPYISVQEKGKKWIMGTFGMAVIALVLAGAASLIFR